MPTPDLMFDHFYCHEEITSFLQALADNYPHLATLSSIGSSAEGRQIWCLTISNKETGAHEDKPAIYVDGNIHAGEVTASHVCLYTSLRLLQGFDTDEEIKYLLDHRTWYILPRVNPDGAELYLTSPYMLRSVTRKNPAWETRVPGALYPEDLDGDGVVRFMRIKDPCGLWKVSLQDKRLLVPRQPADFIGEFYSLHLEGCIHDFSGGPITAAPDHWHIDANRNFPNGWQPNQGQNGLFPLSEEETLAMVRFVLDHPNIGALQAYHTQSGAILRPSSLKPDRDLPSQDIEVFNDLGAIGEKITGYPCVSIMDGFLGGNPGRGIFADWAYDQVGLLSYTTELWDAKQKGGVKDRKEFSKSEFNEEHELAKLKLSDSEASGMGFKDWVPFDHPQLGLVEIGGWHPKFFAQNPWFTLLEDECARNFRFSLQHCAALPEIKAENLSMTRVENGVYRLCLDIANVGWLGTSVTERGKQLKTAKPIRVEISGEELTFLTGTPREEVDHLDGYRTNRESWYTFGRSAPPRRQRIRLQWLVQGQGSCSITVNASRAGTKRITVNLDDCNSGLCQDHLEII